MGNRQQRQRNDAVLIASGSVLKGDPHYGQPVNCYRCGMQHKTRGMVRFQDKTGIEFFPGVQALPSDQRPVRIHCSKTLGCESF